jgi:hypothetical protein
MHEEWLRALRSGEFRQSTSSLYCPVLEAHCCLGVAEQVVFGVTFVEHHVGSEDDPKALDPEQEYMAEQHAELMGLSKLVTQGERVAASLFASERHSDGIDCRHDITRQNVLATLNDSGLTFEDVADFVEAVRWNKG